MNTINFFLSLDTQALQHARLLISPQYASIVAVAGELIVFFAIGLLIGLWLVGAYQKNIALKEKALLIFFTIVGVFIFYALINLGLPKWRPGAMEVVSAFPPLIPHPIDNSFPSGHALLSIALIIGLGKYFKNWYIIVLTIVLACITLSARVIGGVHYPGDILGGLMIGGIIALSIQSLVQISVKKSAPILYKIAGWIKL